MTRIRTDRKIRENPFDLCHPCSLPGGAFYPARRGLAASGAAPVEACGGEGARTGRFWVRIREHGIYQTSYSSERKK
jgi:hypothetical protein